MKLAKALRRCGQNSKAVDVISSVISNNNMNKELLKEETNLKHFNGAKLTALRKSWMGGEKTNSRKTRRSLNADGTMIYSKASNLPIIMILEKFVSPPIQREEDLELKQLRNMRVRKEKEGRWKYLRRRLKESARIEYAKEYMGVLRGEGTNRYEPNENTTMEARSKRQKGGAKRRAVRTKTSLFLLLTPQHIRYSRHEEENYEGR